MINIMTDTDTYQWSWDREDEDEFARRIQLFYDRTPHDEYVLLQAAELVAHGHIDIGDDGRLVAVSDRARFVVELFEAQRDPSIWDELLP
jgi:hypothetical protein